MQSLWPDKRVKSQFSEWNAFVYELPVIVSSVIVSFTKCLSLLAQWLYLLPGEGQIRSWSMWIMDGTQHTAKVNISIHLLRASYAVIEFCCLTHVKEISPEIITTSSGNRKQFCIIQMASDLYIWRMCLSHIFSNISVSLVSVWPTERNLGFILDSNISISNYISPFSVNCLLLIFVTLDGFDHNTAVISLFLMQHGLYYCNCLFLILPYPST